LFHARPGNTEHALLIHSFGSVIWRILWLFSSCTSAVFFNEILKNANLQPDGYSRCAFPDEERNGPLLGNGKDAWVLFKFLKDIYWQDLLRRQTMM
jgi:hypothetical protein